MVHCDVCGDPIAANEKPIELASHDFRDTKFHYHRDEECWRHAIGGLIDLRKQAQGRREHEETAPAATDRRPDPLEFRARSQQGTALHRFDLPAGALSGLYGANLVTIEDCATRSRDEIRRIAGVGPKTLSALDGALVSLGLSFLPDPNMTAGVAS